MQNLSRAAGCLLFFFSGVLLANFAFGVEKIDVNSAPLEDLTKIIHLGETRALELISLRPFSSLDGLARIKGIGAKRVEDIKKQGLAWVGPQLELTENTPPLIMPKEPPTSLAPAEDISVFYPLGIVFNELLPSPEGADGIEEWIEIFNQNNFEVSLSNWQISDMVGSVKAYIFLQGSEIPAKGYLVLARPLTKITLNNDRDGLKLINPRGETIDEVIYEKAPQGESYSKTASGWVWSSILTPELENIISGLNRDSLTTETTVLKPSIVQNIQNFKDTSGLAAISQQLPEEKPAFTPWLISLIIAFFSGIIIFSLKRKLKSGYN